MQFLRAVVGNIHTGVQSHWYDTTPAEHAELLAKAEASGEVVIRPASVRDDRRTWWCRPAGVKCGQPGEYSLIEDKQYGTAYVLPAAPAATPTFF